MPARWIYYYAMIRDFHVGDDRTVVVRCWLPVRRFTALTEVPELENKMCAMGHNTGDALHFLGTCGCMWVDARAFFRGPRDATDKIP
jgi:hypothetical protein